ncbi:hypothetical protein PENTCL1PPCAC_2630 [Pristionchus entomophagus]|uniref:ANK_REP_REGION domain-containing protein n=1 Tax=Pristionchus entomophagus TaxID=358040 RepID=A0AAV5SDE1_9BILA|nr:hypothetical protein PENTCL1PPCAC_2630 [Pristionchus entomophagus]
MANGGKKKNKKSEESGRKESQEEKMNREERDKKRAEIQAKVKKAQQEMEQRVMMNQMAATTSREKNWPKKEGDNDDVKRAADDKRRDSLGGSVSTSSNSSGTDCDEVLSEPNKSAITSPQSGTSEGSPAPSRIHIADAILSIHQVAQSVVEAGTVDALTSLSLKFPPMIPGLVKNKAGARNLAATKSTVAATKENGEGSCAVSSSPSPTPRQVVTPILSGGTPTPSADLAAFRSIADDHPAEIPEATPQTEPEDDVASRVAKIERAKEYITKKERGVYNYPADQLLSFMPQNMNGELQPYRGAGQAAYPAMMRPSFSTENSDAFFHDLLRSQYVHSVNDPAPENGYNSRPDYSLFGIIYTESVGEKPTAYKSLVRDCGQRHDMLGAHELSVRMEKDEGLWLRGERNVLKNIYDDVPKLLAKQKEPWIRELLQLIFDGRPKKVYNRMKVMVNVFRHHEEFQKKTDAEIYTHIAQTLLEAGTNSTMGYSYVHVLASQGNGHKMCGENGHRKCMTLQEVLGPLSPESLQKALSLKTREWRNRTPVHYATATGQPCQLDTLQKFNADVTAPDELGTTPVLYAVIRDNLLMLRMLAWYGADVMQTCDKTGHAVLDYVNVTGKFPLGKACKEFIYRRNDAFEKILKTWMIEITQSSLSIRKGLSEVHTVDCRQPSDQVIEKIPINNEMVNVAHWIGHINKTVHLKLRPNVLNEDRSSMFLLIIPFTYRITDEHQPADYPDVVRRTLFIDEDGLRPIPFFPEPPFMSVKDPLSSRPPLQKALVPLLLQANTGTFWAYKIPSDVFSHECLWVTMSLDLLKVDVALRDNLRLLIQVVSLQSSSK